MGAFGYCELFGGHLAKIDSLEENFCLLDYSHRQGIGHGQIFWDSANDKMSEGVWRHFDNQLLSWTPWWNAGPPGDTSLNCGVFSTGTGRWDDVSCTTSLNYICEKSD